MNSIHYTQEVRIVVAPEPIAHLSMPAIPTLVKRKDSTAPSSPPPPAYEGPSSSNSTSTSTSINSSSSPAPPPPEYTKFSETTRAERCFWYGFLFFPIWFWGFLHFWFSSEPSTSNIPASELPEWSELSRNCTQDEPSSRISTVSCNPSPATTITTSQTPWRWSRNPSPKNQSMSSLTATTLLMNRPDMMSSWRKEERRWAIRCGYAMTASWALALMFLIIAIQSGVLGFTF